VACNDRAAISVPGIARSAHAVLSLAEGESGAPGALARRWPGGVDLLVVDHYGLDARYESACRPWARRLLAIDDLARAHDADVLVDSTPGRAAEAYRGRVPDGCALLAGPEHALLRPAFARARPAALGRRYGKMAPGRVLVSVGATDPEQITGKVLDAIRGAELGLAVDVIMGGGAPGRGPVEKALAAMPLPSRLHVDPATDAMANLMTEADIAVGGAGVSALERCCLGLPALLLVLADNQRGNADALQQLGAGRVASLDGAVPGTTALGEGLTRLGRDAAAIEAMSRAAFAVCDGLGAERVAARIEQLR
jgi:UDP-2,4-diacetamido-2,4,6-trideoxy-beta-L-altropyranose hydrolase